MFSLVSRLGLIVAAACTLAAPASAYDYQESAAPVAPLKGLVYSAEDVATLHRLIRAEEDGQPAAIAARYRRSAGEWMDRSDAEIEALIPKVDAHFAYGLAGDPKTGGPWPRLGAGGVCQIDRPGEVRSPITGDVYGTQAEGEEFYDPGDGWVRPSDGKRFFFKGVWNTYITKALHDAVIHLSIAYMVTGDPEVARRALFILDRMAALRAARPDDLGPSDWPHVRPRGKGFLDVMGNHANTRMMNMALSLDLIGGAPYAQAPSATPGLTVLENLRKHYFSLFETEYYDRKELTNHGVILLGNIVAQGLLFGDAQKLKIGADGVCAFFDNTINRDGDYLEVSGNYGNLGRAYIGSPTLMLHNYDPAKYPGVRGLPQPGDYPFDLKFGDDLRWYRMGAGILFDLPVLDRYPQYGDMEPDWRVLDEPDPALLKARGAYLRLLYHQTGREDWKREISRRYWSLPRAARFSTHQFSLGVSQWTEPARPEAAAETENAAGVDDVEKSTILGGKGIAILKSGEGENRRALFMRGGFNSYHGHDDQMAIVPYGHRMMLAGEYGYNLAGTPDFYGWGIRSISHLMAVVDEDLPASLSYKGMSMKKPAPASSLTGYVNRGPAQLVEMSNPHLWPGDVRDYRRAAWLVDVDAESYYFVDFFHIAGGGVHDYPWNAPFPAKRSDGDFAVEGVAPRPVEGAWTLAALGGQNRDAVWNQPGQSWGERLDGTSGRVRPLPGGPAHPTSDWNPEPGNGYGMIWNVKTEDTAADWRARWRLQDGRHDLRATLLNYDGMTAITANSPSLWGQKPFDLVVARRVKPPGASGAALESRFANVVEVGREGRWPTAGGARLALTGKGGAVSARAAGVRVALHDGGSDVLIVSRERGELRGDGVLTDARNAFARRDRAGAVTALAFQDGTLIEAGGWRLRADAPAFEGRVTEIEADDHRSALTVEPRLPEGGAIAGAMLLIEGDPGAAVPRLHNEYYSIETVAPTEDGKGSRLGFTRQSLIGTSWRGASRKADGTGLTLAWRNAVAGPPGARAFEGCGVFAGTVAKGKPLGLVKTINNQMVALHPLPGASGADGAAGGNVLRVLLASPGDRVLIPNTVTLHQTGDGLWQLRLTTRLSLEIRRAPGTVLLAKGAQGWRRVAQADAAGLVACTLAPEELGSGDILLRFEAGE